MAHALGEYSTRSIPNFITGGDESICPMTCSQIPVLVGNNDGSTYFCHSETIIYYGEPNVDNDLDTDKAYWYRDWNAGNFVCNGKEIGQTFEEGANLATKVVGSTVGSDVNRKCFCKASSDVSMDENSP